MRRRDKLVGHLNTSSSHAQAANKLFSDGCGNTMTKGSYGPTFNAAGGGVYATWLESDALKLYWWKRSDIPADITSGNPDPTKWGTPASQFTSGSNCNIGKYFKDLTIVSTSEVLLLHAIPY